MKVKDLIKKLNNLSNEQKEMEVVTYDDYAVSYLVVDNIEEIDGKLVWPDKDTNKKYIALE